MNTAKNVRALFTLLKYRLTVVKAGTGTGTVTSSPAGISCGADCFENYNSGTTITLTATPASGSRFIRWIDCPSANNNTCTVTLNAATKVRAVFRAT
jgi:hypothetical protein